MAERISQLRLGVTKDIVPYTHAEVLDAQYRLNKFFIKSIQNTLTGAAIGLAASLFFKRKSIIFYSAGFGLGYTTFSHFTGCTL